MRSLADRGNGIEDFQHCIGLTRGQEEMIPETYMLLEQTHKKFPESDQTKTCRRTKRLARSRETKEMQQNIIADQQAPRKQKPTTSKNGREQNTNDNHS